MDTILYGSIFFLSATMLYISGEWVVGGIMRLSRLFGVREFVLAFFIMAIVASIPNFFLGITSAFEGIPSLSLGDVFGNNIIAVTIAAAVGVFFTDRGFIEVEGETVRTSLFFTVASAILPILLIHDGLLSRADAVILLALFLTYLKWLLSKEDLFTKTYNAIVSHHLSALFEHTKTALRDSLRVVTGAFLIWIASMGIVSSATFFAGYFNVPIIIIGLLAVGVGNALPEIYFSLISARRRDTQLIISNLMSSVIIPSTIVLSIVALIHPIKIESVDFVLGTRIFLIVAMIMFFIFSMTRKRIARTEAALLVILYISFVGWILINGNWN